ncbi:MAG TPA: MinD/ParA family protein, partial [Spongiibacteraceae bacterium]|nr:MinD/ParA family protein [Spongiibacteraceae bacterium]
LGISLAKTGARVCIFDADTGLANINILLGLTPQFSLEHVLFGAKTIEEVMLEAPHGLKVIPGANGISECVTLHPRQQLRLTRELGRIESEFDYLLLDTAAGIADSTLDFVGSAHQTMVVVTPEPTSLTDAFSLIKLMHRRRATMNYQVVVNMCSNVAQAREVFHRFAAAVEKYIGVRPNFLGHLLRDESLRVAVTLQSPVALFPDTDPSSRSFMRLTDALKHAVDGNYPSSGFAGFWQRQFRQEQLAQDAKLKAQPVVDAADARGGMADLKLQFADLKSQLLQQMERADVPQSELAETVQALHRSYLQRFAQPAIEPLTLIDALIALPERNDLLLRDLAAQLKPWRTELPHDLPHDLSQFETPPLLTAVEPLPVVVNLESVPLSNVEIPALEIGAAPSIESSPETAVPVERVLPHRYDERRFGSQQALLELLRRQSDGSKSAMALIEIILS